VIDFAGLATAAAVGTSTRPLAAADLPEPILGVVQDADGRDPAEVLLDAAAGYATARRARPAPGPDLPALELPAPSRPQVPDAVVALLHRIAGAGALREPLQREAFAALAARGLTLPYHLMLPLLAEVNRPGVARDVAGLLDARWRAIVALDPVWRTVLDRGAGPDDAADPQVWEDGSAEQRAAYLAAVRRSDPAAGRALLDGPGFAKENAETRELLLRQLTHGLGADDEPLLEARLDDRAKGVRELAAALLAWLPGSAYVARAESLAGAHVRLQKRLLRGPLTVVAPVPVTAATRRDLYREKDLDNQPAERLHLFDVLGIVPTDRWPSLVGATAADLATGPAEYLDAPIDLRPAFAVAAMRWRDADLAAALGEADPSLLPVLLPVLEPGLRDRLVVDALAGETGAQLVTLIVPQPMSPTVAVAALDVIGRLALQRDQAYRASELLTAVGRHADPLAAPALLDGLADLSGRLPEKPPVVVKDGIRAASTALQLRQALAEALLAYPLLTPEADPKG